MSFFHCQCSKTQNYSVCSILRIQNIQTLEVTTECCFCLPSISVITDCFSLFFYIHGTISIKASTFLVFTNQTKFILNCFVLFFGHALFGKFSLHSAYLFPTNHITYQSIMIKMKMEIKHIHIIRIAKMEFFLHLNDITTNLTKLQERNLIEKIKYFFCRIMTRI